MTTACSELLSAIAALSERFHRTKLALREDPAVRNVVAGLAARPLPGGDRIECYVDAELASGNAVGWWFEFWYADSHWNIESSVRINTPSGEEELVEMPPRLAADDQTLVAELAEASAALLATRASLKLGEL